MVFTPTAITNSISVIIIIIIIIILIIVIISIIIGTINWYIALKSLNARWDSNLDGFLEIFS